MAACGINAALLQTYWQIGKIIVENEQNGNDKAEHGKATLKKLANALTLEFGKGFDDSNLRNMRGIYRVNPIKMKKLKITTFILLSCLYFSCQKNKEDDQYQPYGDGIAEATALGNKISFKIGASMSKQQNITLSLAYYDYGIQRLYLEMNNLPKSTDTTFFDQATTQEEPATFLDAVKEDHALDLYRRIDYPNTKSFVVITKLDTVKQEMEGVFQLCYGIEKGFPKEDIFPDTLIFTEGRFSTKYKNY